MGRNAGGTAPYAIIGVVATIIFASIWIVAASNDPLWVFGESMLSDMGVSEERLTADLFNYGCMLTGALLAVFGLGRSITSSDRFIGVAIVFAGAFLFLIGMFDENTGAIHDACASLFFIILILTMFVTIVTDWNHGRRFVAMITAVLIVTVMSTFVGKPLPYIEAIAVISGLIWVIGQSYVMVTMKRSVRSE